MSGPTVVTNNPYVLIEDRGDGTHGIATSSGLVDDLEIAGMLVIGLAHFTGVDAGLIAGFVGMVRKPAVEAAAMSENAAIESAREYLDVSK